MARFVILETAALDKLQQMICDEIQATESVILKYEQLGNSTDSLNWDLEKLKGAQYALTHSKKAQ